MEREKCFDSQQEFEHYRMQVEAGRLGDRAFVKRISKKIKWRMKVPDDWICDGCGKEWPDDFGFWVFNKEKQKAMCRTCNRKLKREDGRGSIYSDSPAGTAEYQRDRYQYRSGIVKRDRLARFPELQAEMKLECRICKDIPGLCNHCPVCTKVVKTFSDWSWRDPLQDETPLCCRRCRRDTSVEWETHVIDGRTMTQSERKKHDRISKLPYNLICSFCNKHVPNPGSWVVPENGSLPRCKSCDSLGVPK